MHVHCTVTSIKFLFGNQHVLHAQLMSASAFGSSLAKRYGCRVAAVRLPVLRILQPRFAVLTGTHNACRPTARGVSRFFSCSADHDSTSEVVCTHLHKSDKEFGNVFAAPTAVVMGDVTLGPHSLEGVFCNVFVASTAVVVGDVTLGSHSSVWYGAVIRADLNSVVIGDGSNVQDGACIHLSSAQGVIIGKGVTIGHKAIIHGCSVEDNCLIG